MENNTDAPVHFNMTKGIVIGGKDTVLTKLAIICSNATTKNVNAVEFDMNLEARVNLTMKDMVFFPHIDMIQINNTMKKNDIVGMYARDYNNFF